VTLPRKDKRATPRYQDLRAAAIPVARSEDGLATVRVVAGEALGVSATTHTHTPILYLHASLAPGGSLVQPVPPGWHVLAYVFQGRARVGREERLVRAGELAVLEAEGGPVAISAAPGEGAAEVLLVGGEPIGEPIARYGPFVMNTEDEILEAVQDYRAGRMGEIPAETGAAS
jgi:redox-sensitive bicupin YhaK (pirin superfamily)